MPIVCSLNTGTKTRWTFEEWARRIDNNFESHFWINPIPDPLREPRSEMINRRGIYKDSYLASKPWADFQLRPNFVVAMAVVSEMDESIIESVESVTQLNLIRLLKCSILRMPGTLCKWLYDTCWARWA